jgi:hypothetical protein
MENRTQDQLHDDTEIYGVQVLLVQKTNYKRNVNMNTDISNSDLHVVEIPARLKPSTTLPSFRKLSRGSRKIATAFTYRARINQSHF